MFTFFYKHTPQTLERQVFLATLPKHGVPITYLKNLMKSTKEVHHTGKPDENSVQPYIIFS